MMMSLQGVKVPEMQGGDLSNIELSWFQRLNIAVHVGDEQRLISVLSEIDLTQALSQRIINGARARKKTPLVLLLLTLAVANDVEAARANVWLTRYQYINGHAEIPLDPPETVVYQVCHSLRQQSPLSALAPAYVGANEQAWQDAFELALDFEAWTLAREVLERAKAQQLELTTWGKLAASLMLRRRFWGAGVDHAQVALVFEILSEALAASGGAQAAEALKVFQAKQWVNAGNWTKAQDIYEQLLVGTHQVVAHLEQAQMFCRSARQVQALHTLDELLSLPLGQIRRSRERDAEQLDPLPSAGKKDFNLESAEKAWQAFHDALAHTGIPYFLVSGTLLGYAREGGLLAHDKDIDVGIADFNQQYAMAEALQASGAFTIDLDKLTGKSCLGFSVTHSETNIAIDVFIYSPVGECWQTGVQFAFGHVQRFDFTPFELHEGVFLGATSWVPADVDLNLRENFGPRWKEPDPGYISHLESPSTCDVGGGDYMVTLRLEIFSALVSNKRSKLQRVLSLHDGLPASDLKLSPSLFAHLQDMLANDESWA